MPGVPLGGGSVLRMTFRLIAWTHLPNPARAPYRAFKVAARFACACRTQSHARELSLNEHQRSEHKFVRDPRFDFEEHEAGCHLLLLCPRTHVPAVPRSRSTGAAHGFLTRTWCWAYERELLYEFSFFLQECAPGSPTWALREKQQGEQNWLLSILMIPQLLMSLTSGRVAACLLDRRQLLRQ